MRITECANWKAGREPSQHPIEPSNWERAIRAGFHRHHDDDVLGWSKHRFRDQKELRSYVVRSPVRSPFALLRGLPGCVDVRVWLELADADCRDARQCAIEFARRQ